MPQNVFGEDRSVVEGGTFNFSSDRLQKGEREWVDFGFNEVRSWAKIE